MNPKSTNNNNNKKNNRRKIKALLLLDLADKYRIGNRSRLIVTIAGKI